MRIAFLLPDLRPSGGSRCVVEYANGLARRGHDVAIVSSKASNAYTALHPDAGVTLLQSRRRLSRRGILDNVGLAVDMLRLVPACDVVVATHTPSAPLAVAAARLRKSCVAAWLCMDYPEMFAGRPLQSLIYRFAPRWFKTILCLSNSTATELKEKRFLKPAGSVTVVGLGLSDQSAFRPAPFEARDRREVLFVGDSRPRKGMADLLAAMRIVGERVHGVRLTVVSREDLSPLGSSTSTYEVRCVASPDVGTLAKLYRSCGVFVSASWAEGFGLPPLEAMACGTPVVVTDSRGVREFARHEENCLVVTPRDFDAMAEAIVRLLVDPELADRLGAEGIRTASGFGWAEAIDRFELAIRQGREAMRPI